jgi:hypothetical protein
MTISNNPLDECNRMAMISFSVYNGSVVELRGDVEQDIFEKTSLCAVGGFSVYSCAKRTFVEQVLAAQDTRFALLVSLKSRAFSHATLKNALSVAAKFSGKCLVSVVDAPYRWNEQAVHFARQPDKANRRLNDLSIELWNRLENAIRQFPTLSVTRMTWTELLADTPTAIKQECEAAFSTGGKFFFHVMRITKEVFERSVHAVDMRTASRFLVEELPVLFWLYYGADPIYVDLYPAPPPSLFRLVEDGEFRDELPVVTAAAATRKLIHIDIRT